MPLEVRVPFSYAKALPKGSSVATDTSSDSVATNTSPILIVSPTVAASVKLFILEHGGPAVRKWRETPHPSTFPNFQVSRYQHINCNMLILLTTILMSQTLALAPSSTVVIGLNAALQKRFILPPKAELEPGAVHRSERVETGVGGKGQDVGVALSCLMSADGSSDNENKVILAQFIGQGPEGDSVLSTLKSLHLSSALTIRNAAPLRTCTTIVSDSSATELVENSGTISKDEMNSLFHQIESLTKGDEEGKAGAVCIMGSMPPGCKDDTYAQLTKRLCDGKSLVLIDSVVGLDPLLEALNNVYKDKSQGGGAVLKLNAAELCKLANVPKKESERVTLEELKQSTQGFMSKHTNAKALDYLCVTDGKFPGYLVELAEKGRMWQLDTIDLSTRGTLYPIGAGDTVAAGTLAAWQYLQNNNGVFSSSMGAKLSGKQSKWGMKMATAFAFGIACGSASCLKEENSVFDVEDALRFLDGMKDPVLTE